MVGMLIGISLSPRSGCAASTRRRLPPGSAPAGCAMPTTSGRRHRAGPTIFWGAAVCSVVAAVLVPHPVPADPIRTFCDRACRDARRPMASEFDDLLAANPSTPTDFHDGWLRRHRARRRRDGHLHGLAHRPAGDARPLAGDAKIFRNPGGRVTEAALEALVLGVHLLGVDRILIVPHTRCAMAATAGRAPRAGRRGRRRRRVAADVRVVPDQEAALQDDVPRCARTRWSPTRSRSAGSSTTSTPGC